MTVTIAILGANGQVGSEVCLYLNAWPGVRVVPICRNPYGSTLLRRAGLECRHGVLDSKESAGSLLDGCDLMVDFTRPLGLATEVREATRRTIANAIQYGPSRAPFVYASTMMAFGMPAGGARFRRHLFARTVYGANKRWAERCAQRLGRRAGRAVYVLRIAQVHGELQAVSREWLDALRDGQIPSASDAESFTVFAGTIAEALVQIATGCEQPGTYTLLSSPPWRWWEVYEYYCKRSGIPPRTGAHSQAGPPVRRPFRALQGFAVRHRDLATGYLFPHFPSLEMRAMSWHFRRQARAEMASDSTAEAVRMPYAGPFPGAQLRSLTDSRRTLEPRAEAVRAILRQVAALAPPPPVEPDEDRKPPPPAEDRTKGPGGEGVATLVPIGDAPAGAPVEEPLDPAQLTRPTFPQLGGSFAPSLWPPALPRGAGGGIRQAICRWDPLEEDRVARPRNRAAHREAPAATTLGSR